MSNKGTFTVCYVPKKGAPEGQSRSLPRVSAVAGLIVQQSWWMVFVAN